MIAEVGPSGPALVAIVYHHPGRLRLRGGPFEGPSPWATRVGGVLGATSGVERVIHNAASGSLLVEYAHELVDADAILDRVVGAGLRLDDRTRLPDASRAVVGAARELNANVAAATRGALDLHGAVSFALGIGAVASLALGRSPRWPRWDNLLYWSYTFFREKHLRDLERSRAGR